MARFRTEGVTFGHKDLVMSIFRALRETGHQPSCPFEVCAEMLCVMGRATVLEAQKKGISEEEAYTIFGECCMAMFEAVQGYVSGFVHAPPPGAAA